jgi:outer membrane protein assembly factor BamB
VWTQDALLRRSLTGPALSGGALVIGDFDGYLHWLDRDSGRFIAREHAGRDRISVAPLVDGNRVFVIDDGGRIAAFRSGGAAGG